VSNKVVVKSIIKGSYNKVNLDNLIFELSKTYENTSVKH